MNRNWNLWVATPHFCRLGETALGCFLVCVFACKISLIQNISVPWFRPQGHPSTKIWWICSSYFCICSMFVARMECYLRLFKRPQGENSVDRHHSVLSLRCRPWNCLSLILGWGSKDFASSLPMSSVCLAGTFKHHGIRQHNKRRNFQSTKRHVTMDKIFVPRLVDHPTYIVSRL